SMALGQRNVGGGNPTAWVQTDPLLEVGNGIGGTPSNALTILKNGTVTAPSFDMAEITDPKALITKEYLENTAVVATGLEAIDEGNGIGWRLIGRDTAFYDNIGFGAVDLSRSVFNNVAGASGEGAFAVGYAVNATGDYAVGMGISVEASGTRSTAMGTSTTASGSRSTAMGASTEASGDYSTAMGNITRALGDYSTAMGNLTTALGNYSTTMGYGS